MAGEQKYRDRAWRIFTAIEKNCRVDDHGGANGAYGAYPDVGVAGRKPNDKMESFFMGETMKYLYLIFANQTGLLPLMSSKVSRHAIFNTEAHPFPTLRAPLTDFTMIHTTMHKPAPIAVLGLVVAEHNVAWAIQLLRNLDHPISQLILICSGAGKEVQQMVADLLYATSTYQRIV